METLDNTEWDVLIVGTGLQQSLLALALSRSGKKILHIDENNYYGGSEAAFNLQEAEEWAKKVTEDSSAAAFSNASVSKPESTECDSVQTLSSSRLYSLELSPQLIYARSSLLQYLVSSKVYRQLEFLAVGSWWVYSTEASNSEDATATSDAPFRHGKLLKVPNGREDVFQDQVLDFKAKRALMKFLRFIAEYEDQKDVWDEYRHRSFSAFLTQQFKVPVDLQAALLALTLSPTNSEQTTTEYALPRIARHLRSIGVFGPGFGSVLPKWGGLSDIVQVACRSSAVGGGVYVLNKGLSGSASDFVPDSGPTESIKLRLKDGETVVAQWVVENDVHNRGQRSAHCKSITVVSSSLGPLFPPIAEDAPPPASAVVVFPSGSLALDEGSDQGAQLPPVHVFVHSSDTNECPAGQSILYAFTSLHSEKGFQLLKKAVDILLGTVEVTPTPTILWSMQFEQDSSSATSPGSTAFHDRLVRFPSSPLDLAFDDIVLDHVKEVWQKIVGDEAGEFLVFEDREANVDDDE